VAVIRPQGEPRTAGVSLVGRYIRRSRQSAGLTQKQLADRAGVSQSMVSRVERGLEPEIPLDRLIKLVQPLARFFPVGVCPHDHNCRWQPFPIPGDPSDQHAASIEYLLAFE
jgi:transcriptional regulator with XRE-family HTH domain